MFKVIKLEDVLSWIDFKTNQEISGTAGYRSGYLDGLENLKQDIVERRIPIHLFTGTEEESVIL